MEGEPWIVRMQLICLFLAQMIVFFLVYKIVHLIHLPGPATMTIAPATMARGQQKTTKETLQIQQRKEEELLFLLTTEELFHSISKEELQPLQITGKELQSQQTIEEEGETPIREEFPPQLTTEGQLQSAIKEALQPLQITEVEHQSQQTTKEEDQSPIREDFLHQQTTKGEPHLQQTTVSKLQSANKELHPLKTIKETYLPQQAAEELQYEQIPGVDLQPQQIIKEEFQSKLKSAAEEELLPRHSAKEDRKIVIRNTVTLLINLWNGKSLKKGKGNMKACFRQINLPSQFLATRSANACNSCSRGRYEYANGFLLVKDETRNLFNTFKSLDSLYHGGVHFIDHSLLSEVDGMTFQIAGLGYQQILHNIIEDNADFLDRFFCDYFKAAGLSIDLWACMDASQFTFKSTKKCVKTLKIATALLCFIGHELTEADCKSFNKDLRMHYFSVCARRPIENLIKAVDSISNLKLSTDHIYQMLILYEANADVLRAFDYPVMSDQIFRQMRANFNRVFDGIKYLIRDKLDCSQGAIIPIRHPVTNVLVDYMKLFTNHRNSFQAIFVGDHSSSLCRLISEVISCWAEELERHSVPDTQGSNYIFLLNNLTHFISETTILLEELIPIEGAEILQPFKSRVDEYILKYLEKCWGPVRDLVVLNSGEKPCLQSLTEFIRRFKDICNCQRSWVLQTQLKEKLQDEIKRFIIPFYEAFLEELLKTTPSRTTFLEELQKIFPCAGHIYQDDEHMTALELASYVEELFESE